MRRVLFLEPFYGGSHKDFADGLVANSTHDIDLHTLPARFWKWRMRGAALYFSHDISNPEDFDLLIVSDMMSLSDLQAIWGSRCPPSVVYFHENQLSYPLPPGERMDYHFGFTNITTCLSATRLLFNSQFHLDSFLGALPAFIRKMPEYKPAWATELIRRKSEVIYPGCQFPADGFPGGEPLPARGRDGKPPLLLWNHRWEFDKDPDAFFGAAGRVADRGVDFELALLGENFQSVPKAFEDARRRFGDRIVQYGFVETKDEYLRWLSDADIVVSTAIQENFGISIVEAMRYGCLPLLPTRLSYPEILPREYHSICLYADTDDLASKLESALRGPIDVDLSGLASSMARYAWEQMAPTYDSMIENVAGLTRGAHATSP